MGKLKLVEPNEHDLERVAIYRQLFLDMNESMDGTSRLRDFEDMQEWLAYVRKSKMGLVSDWVEDEQYLCVEEETNQLVGMVDIRLSLNEVCFAYYGNIGYCVSPLHRNRGYAKEMLGLALEICKEKQMDKVLVCCYKNNIASRKVIIANGGVLENEVLEEGDSELTQRYWIRLKEKENL